VSLARLDDGGHVLVEVSTVPTEFSEDGTTFQAVQVTIRDITARRQADAALRASEALYRGILENVRALAMCLDADGRVTFANDAFLEATGWPREAVLGADYFARFVPHLAKAPDHYRTAMAMGMVDGIPAHYAAEVQRRDGTVRHIEWDTTVLRDADGRAVGVASVGQDVTEQRALAARLAALSENDELTGLHNRRGFRRMAEQELRSAARTERCDAVLYVDLDRFKPINDTYGHASGDEALRSVATVIQTTLRDADFGARLGGDEFAIYAVGLHPGDGDVVAARLRANLAAHNAVAAAAGRPFHLEFSVGVAERAPGEALDVLLARADASLYAQKLARKAGEHERR
jgi:diguanylate cyclase (GGDEF)-like protein/PAS domain S-box-containing protein